MLSFPIHMVSKTDEITLCGKRPGISVFAVREASEFDKQRNRCPKCSSLMQPVPPIERREVDIESVTSFSYDIATVKFISKHHSCGSFGVRLYKDGSDRLQELIDRESPFVGPDDKILAVTVRGSKLAGVIIISKDIHIWQPSEHHMPKHFL